MTEMMYSDIVPMGTKKNLKETHPSQWVSFGITPFSLHKMQCCGTRELYSTPSTIYYSKDSFFRWLWWDLVGEEGNRDWLPSTEKGVPRTGMLLLVLGPKDIYGFGNTDDKKKWAMEMGFRPLGSFNNWVHEGRELTLYGFQVPKDLSQWKSPSLAEWKKMEEEKKKEKKECA